MKTIKQYITEFVNINNVNIYKYHPKTKDELIKAIKTELKEGNTDLNCIDTSDIYNMAWLFDQKNDGIELTNKQQKYLDISEWDVSKVEDMRYMFNSCEQFNSDLSNWVVSNVEYMEYMFEGCGQFNSDLSNWNVSNVTNMHGMFYGSGLAGNEPSWYKK